MRIGITGLGGWTAYGVGWTALRDGLLAARSALTAVDDIIPELPGARASVIRDLTPFRRGFPEVRPPLPIPSSQHVMLAAQEALRSADLLADPQREQIGVFLGRNRGPALVVARTMLPVYAGGPRKTSPLLFSQCVANAPLGAVSTHYALRGPNLMTMGGGTLMLALDTMRRGDAPALLVGGFEGLEPHCFVAGVANGFIRPTDPRGPTFGEGAVCLVLEPIDRARARGARVLAELCAAESGLGAPVADVAALFGWGSPSAARLVAVCRDALAAAGSLAPPAFHSGSANGEPRIDAAERDALRELGLDIPSRSVKHLLGDGLGMGAALGLAFAVDALATGRLPRLTAEGADDTPGDVALVTNLEFHGSIFAAVLRRCDP
jgi:3-oxoacyl-[acyl-carrier-protein] synthase II